MHDILFYGLDQLAGAVEDTTTNALSGDFPEPSFDEIEPGRRRGNEVEVETWVLLEPGLHLGMFVRSVVVHDAVDVE